MRLQTFLSSDVGFHLLDHASNHVTQHEHHHVQDKCMNGRLEFMFSTYGVNPRGMNYDILETVIHHDLRQTPVFTTSDQHVLVVKDQSKQSPQNGFPFPVFSPGQSPDAASAVVSIYKSLTHLTLRGEVNIDHQVIENIASQLPNLKFLSVADCSAVVPHTFLDIFIHGERDSLKFLDFQPYLLLRAISHNFAPRQIDTSSLLSLVCAPLADDCSSCLPLLMCSLKWLRTAPCSWTQASMWSARST